MATPKVTRQLFDNNLTRAVESSGPRNRRVVILGNALDGPLNTPVKISSPADAADKFGPFKNEAFNLTKGIKECFDAQSNGAASPDIYGMRVVGYIADGTARTTAAERIWNDLAIEPPADVFKLEAVNPGSFYNDISVWADAEDLHIYNPKTKLTTKITYASEDIPNMDMLALAEAINANIGLNKIMYATSIVDAQAVTATIFSGVEASPQSLASGADWDLTGEIVDGLGDIWTVNDQLYLGLEKAYDNFIVDFFDIMAVADLTIDASVIDGDRVSSSFATQLSDFLNDFNGEMIGTISFEPLQGSGVGGRVMRDDVTSRLNTVLNDSVVAGLDQPFMFCVDGEGIFSGQSSRYAGNLNCAIAGLISAMPTEEAIYRHILPGVQGLVWSYGGRDKSSGDLQVDLLSDARISVPQSKNGEIRLSESRSLAKVGSDYENLMTVLILQEALEICRNVAKDFLGKVSSAELLQAFQTNLNSQLGASLVPRVLRGFKAPVVMTPGERVVGRITIPLTLQPQFEIRDVHYNVELSAEDLV